jgi:DNA-binding NtrC family response regulator
MPTLLIVEDESKLRKLLVRSLQDQPQWKVHSVSTAEEALTQTEQHQPDVILTDLRLPGLSGLDLIHQVRKQAEPPRFVMMTAYASVNSAVEALRAGAVDYLIKPFPNEELLHVLGRIEHEIHLSNENQVLRNRLAVYEGPPGLIGSSEVIARLCRLIARVAPTQSTVLIRGESGTGKELIARAIHEQSGRSMHPLVRVNCGAIPESLLESELFGHVKGAFTGATERRVGRFEMAGQGTLLLDEMGELPLGLQVKLLRILQEREYEPVGSSQTQTSTARILAATNRDLEAAIRVGTFREDLYYRLNVVTIQAPSLKEHLEDIEELAEHFVRRISTREGLPCKTPSEEFLVILKSWHWPGNVRELENTLEAALIMGEGEHLEVEDLPQYIRRGKDSSSSLVDEGSESLLSQPISLDPGKTTLEEVERHLLTKALEQSGGNQSEAARRLGITRRTLAYRREKYGI